MTEMLRQSLSAVIDDEADAFELRRVLDELKRDPELRALWDRYHLIGSTLRGERQPVRPQMRELIWQAVDGELGDAAVASAAPLAEAGRPPEEAPAATGRRRGGTAALAVAATVALAVVFGATFFSGETPDSAVPALAGTDIDSSISTVMAGPGGRDTAEAFASPASTEISPSDLQRAHAYMLHHTQQQAMNQSSVMSLVKLATYEAP
jgi:sigma-E factor negative regulatory protein RseA